MVESKTKDQSKTRYRNKDALISGVASRFQQRGALWLGLLVSRRSKWIGRQRSLTLSQATVTNRGTWIKLVTTQPRRVRRILRSYSQTKRVLVQWLPSWRIPKPLQISTKCRWSLRLTKARLDPMQIFKFVKYLKRRKTNRKTITIWCCLKCIYLEDHQVKWAFNLQPDECSMNVQWMLNIEQNLHF